MFSAPSPAPVQMPAPSTTALAPSAPIGQKPQTKNAQPSFLGAIAAQPANTGQKTLLGT